MATKETSGYNQSKTPVSDPTHLFTGVTAATDSATPSTLTYTTASKHNFVVGQSVLIFGFAVAAYNFSPDLVVKAGGTVGDVSTALGAGRPAVVTAVATDKLSFKVLATAQVSSASTGTGYVLNTADESNSPWDTSWLPTSTAADTAANYQVGLEWGDSFPIQPNDGRLAATGATSKTTASISGVTANGSTIVYTVASDPTAVLSSGSWISIDGIVPSQFNFNSIQVASVTSTQVTVVNTATGKYDSVNSFGQIAPITLTGGTVQAVVATTTAVTAGPRSVSVTGAAGDGTKFTYTVPSGHGIAVGQTVSFNGIVPTAYNITGVVSTSNATDVQVANTTANPGALTKVGSASVQNIVYKTVSPHGLIAGQDTIVTGAATSAGASLPEYNISGTVISTQSSTLFSLPAKKYSVNAATTAPIVVTGTAVQYVLQGGHNATTSDSVSVYGFVGGANLNTVTDVAVSATTANSITINTPAQVALSSATLVVASNQLTITKAASFGSIVPGQIATIAGVAGVANTDAFNASFLVVSATAGALVVAMPTGVATASANVASATLTVSATTAATPISGVTAVSTTGQTLTATQPNNFIVGQSVTVAGTGASAYNTTATVTAASAKEVTVTYPLSVTLSGTPAVSTSAAPLTISSKALPIAASGVSADSSKFGYLVEKGTTWASGSTAFVGGADYGWGASYTVAPIALNPNLDSHEIVTSPRTGYPDYYPTYKFPSVVGKTYTNAVQTLLANGFTAYSDVTPTAALSVTAVNTTSSQVTYTVGSGHLISAGDAVLIDNKSGYSSPSPYALKTVNVVSTAATTITVNQTGVSGSYTSGDVTVTPNNGVVTAVKKVDNSTSVSAGDTFTAGTDTLAVILTHYKGL